MKADKERAKIEKKRLRDEAKKRLRDEAKKRLRDEANTEKKRLRNEATAEYSRILTHAKHIIQANKKAQEAADLNNWLEEFRKPKKKIKVEG